ncbi:MAG: hypothetical protein R3F59_27975 [Myxococcota bacterium]
MRTIRLTPLAALLVGGCDYEAPIDGAPVTNVISGQAIFAGEPATTIVTGFLANNPPPPTGRGSPVLSDTVGASTFSGDGLGLQSGEFFLTHVPDGSYIIAAIMDVDGNFNPFASVLTGATCGDWLGLHTADLATGAPGIVTVEGGELIEDLPVLVTTEMTLQRPVFELVTPGIGIGALLGGTQSPLFRIRTTAVDTAFSADLPLAMGLACAPDPACTEGRRPACATSRRSSHAAPRCT